MPHGVVIARSAAQVAALLETAQAARVRSRARGGLTTRANRGVRSVLLDMTGRPRARDRRRAPDGATEAGIFWASLRGAAARGARYCRRRSTDLVRGRHARRRRIDVIRRGSDAAPTRRWRCRWTPTVKSSNARTAQRRAFRRAILGYGQVGVITEATLRTGATRRSGCAISYSSLRTAIEDLQMLDRNDASDYSGILTDGQGDRPAGRVRFGPARSRSMRAAAAAARQRRSRVRAAHGAALCLAAWRCASALPVAAQARAVPQLRRAEYMRGGRMHDAR